VIRCIHDVQYRRSMHNAPSRDCQPPPVMCRAALLFPCLRRVPDVAGLTRRIIINHPSKGYYQSTSVSCHPYISLHSPKIGRFDSKVITSTAKDGCSASSRFTCFVLCATSSIPAWSTRPTPNRVYDEIDELSGTFTAAVDPENGPRVVRRDEQKML
jgi:hypothetical protein